MTKNIIHIGFIALELYPNKTGGMEIFNYYLIKELSNSCQITVYTTKKVPLPSKIRVIIVSPKLFGVSGFKLGQIWVGIKVFFHLCWSFNNRPDLIHIPFTSNAKHYGLVYPVFLRALKIPYIASIHGGGLHPWKPYWMYSLFFKHATKIIAASNAIKKEYEKRTNRDIRVILPLIPFALSGEDKDKIRVTHGIEENKFVILFLGTLKEIKHPLDIILALNYLGLEFLRINNIILLFVGDGPQRKELEYKVMKLKLTDHVRFIGEVHFEKTAQYYEISNLYIISSRFEGTSKSLIGAMYYGLPIIASDVDGIRDIIQNNQNGLLYPLGEIKALANCIKRMINDQILRNKLVNQNKISYDKNYCYINTIKQFLWIYSITLEEHNAKFIKGKSKKKDL